jgi:drug/metabolite transporter (DMT)-like permease
MVGLVQHAHDDRTPAGVSWLLGGAVALALGFIAVESSAVEGSGAASSRFVVGTYAAGTVLVLALAAARPAPWLLATLVVLVLGSTWLVCFVPSLGRESDHRTRPS